MFGLGGDKRDILRADNGKGDVPEGSKEAFPASEREVTSERAWVVPVTESYGKSMMCSHVQKC